jgi:Ser/Thr protein kinase RdoA (MazF antagonist)
MEDDTNSKLRKSPTTMMAEASVLSQKTALKEADNLKSMVEIQKEELVLRKHNSELQREEWKAELSLMKAERESSISVVYPSIGGHTMYVKSKLD